MRSTVSRARSVASAMVISPASSCSATVAREAVGRPRRFPTPRPPGSAISGPPSERRLLALHGGGGRFEARGDRPGGGPLRRGRVQRRAHPELLLDALLDLVR